MATRPKTQHIYLVDDDQEDRDMFSEALSQIDKPTQLTEFCSCFKLIEALENITIPAPDIIFLDLDLPKFGGLECLKKIKASKKLKELKIVILSTFAHEQYIDEAYKSGAKCYYVKPSRFPKLKDLISHALNENQNSHFSSKTNFVVNYV